MGKIVVNGVTLQVDNARSISIRNGEVRVDGKIIHAGASGAVHVYWNGPLANLDTDGDATIQGGLTGSASAGGNVTVGGEVQGDVSAGGNVRCGKVSGRMSAGGNITAS